MKKRLDYVLGNRVPKAAPVVEETEYDGYQEQETKRVSEEQVLNKLEKSYQESKKVSTDESVEEDETLSYFAKLAES